VCEVAEDVFGMPARVGLPGRASGQFGALADPAYAAAVGATLLAIETPSGRVVGERPIAATVQRVRQWVDSLL
jgi:hypothetical protein